MPLGSGAIESSIRRVINLRLKGNAVFRREANAESMLQLRALVICDRWDEGIRTMRSYKTSTQIRESTWNPRPMSEKSELKSTTAKNTA